LLENKIFITNKTSNVCEPHVLHLTLTSSAPTLVLNKFQCLEHDVQHRRHFNRPLKQMQVQSFLFSEVIIFLVAAFSLVC